MFILGLLIGLLIGLGIAIKAYRMGCDDYCRSPLYENDPRSWLAKYISPFDGSYLDW